jgi:hypothetical protein
VRETVDHRALETELLDAARQLVRGRRRIRGRQRGERRIARRLRRDDLREPIIDAAREFDLRRMTLSAATARYARAPGCRCRPRPMSFTPRRAGVGELLQHMRRRRGVEALEQRDQLRVGIVLLDRDDRDNSASSARRVLPVQADALYGIGPVAAILR